MLGSIHNRPQIPAGARVETLRRPDEKANRITPESIVTVINRGREVLTRKFDGEDYNLFPFTHDGGTVEQPYLMQMPYAAAVLFQTHTPIPGTRDPNSNTLASESWLGILDTDPPEFCDPLTDEECQRFGQAIEAIERPGDDGSKIVDVKTVNRRRIGAGGLGNAVNRKPQTTTGEEGDREADALAREHMRPPDGVSDEIRGEEAEGAAAEAAGEMAGGRKGRRR